MRTAEDGGLEARIGWMPWSPLQPLGGNLRRHGNALVSIESADGACVALWFHAPRGRPQRFARLS